MKKSKYNIAVVNNDKVLLYNTFRDSMMVVSKSYYQYILDTKEDYSKLKALDKLNYDNLIEHGYLIDDDIDEYKQLCFAHKMRTYHNDTYTLTVLPTLDCNLRCWYCFEKHIKDSRLSTNVKSMIKEYTKKIANSEEYTCLKLDFFGGEPLLHFEEDVYPLLKDIQDYFHENKKQLVVLFVTNGVYLNDKVIDKLSEFDEVAIQVSTDGNKNEHDKVKFIPGSREGTYNQIMENVRKICDRLHNIFINLRINYTDETLKNIDGYIEEVKNIDRNKIEIHLERVWQTKQKGMAESELLQNAINMFITNGFYVTYSHFHRRNYSCKTEKYAQAVISYDGKIYKCTGRDFTTDMEEGYMDDNNNIQWDINKLSKRIGLETFSHTKCKTCKFLPLCWGPCSQASLEMKAGELDNYCYLNKLELSIDNLIRYMFNNNLALAQRQV